MIWYGHLKEGGSPNIQIALDHVYEDIIIWWNNFKKSNPKFQGLSENCSTIITQALDTGGGTRHAPNAPHPIVATPGSVLDYAQQLQKAGSGVYVPPPLPPPPPNP